MDHVSRMQPTVSPSLAMKPLKHREGVGWAPGLEDFVLLVSPTKETEPGRPFRDGILEEGGRSISECRTNTSLIHRSLLL
jgi:hypothetical protein